MSLRGRGIFLCAKKIAIMKKRSVQEHIIVLNGNKFRRLKQMLETVCNDLLMYAATLAIIDFLNP